MHVWAIIFYVKTYKNILKEYNGKSRLNGLALGTEYS